MRRSMNRVSKRDEYAMMIEIKLTNEYRDAKARCVGTSDWGAKYIEANGGDILWRPRAREGGEDWKGGSEERRGRDESERGST